MAFARLTSAKSLLSRRSALRNVICLIGFLAVTVLPGHNSKTQIRPAGAEFAETQLSTRISVVTLINGSTNSADLGQRPPKQLNHASTPAGQSQTASHSPVPTEESDVTIVPKIEYAPNAHLWADGRTPAVFFISLKEVKGNQSWSYTAREELVFQLEPRTALFTPSQVKIAAGASISEPVNLIAKQPIKLPVTCAPARKYDGLAITNPQPENIEFIPPIDAIGIESRSNTSQVNIAVPIEIFLYNRNDPQKTRLRPPSPVSVQLVSESGNGKIITNPVQLTEVEFSKYVDYVGTKTGRDTITAIGSYQSYQISGSIDRTIVFPLWIFVSGLAGSMLGSGVRYYRAKRSQRKKIFFESLFYGVVVCLLLIIYPVGTKLPQISNFIQPLLLFVLGALVSVYGPQSLQWALSFIPKGDAQENA